jgi:Zn-dependent M28 family amino/carboxypeptidase
VGSTAPRLRPSASAVLLSVALSLTLLAPAAVGESRSEIQQSKLLRDKVTVQGMQRHLAAWQEIADENGGHRFAGLPGYEESADYVYDRLSRAGYEPTYHSFEYNAFIELSASVLEQVSPAPATYVNGNDFRIMTYSGSGDVTANLAVPSGDIHGCSASDYAGFPDGAIAIVSRGAPVGFPVSCSFRLKTESAAAGGASAVLVYNNVPGLLNGTLGEAGGLSEIPSLGLTQALGQSLVAQMSSGPVAMHVKTDTDTDTLTTRNVLAELKGKRDDVIVVGAHLDSVNAGPGINDNGSGSAAILEVAIQMRKVNKNPENTIRFAWWSAEESGLIGSTRYVSELSADELSKIKMNLNFDMVGSPNYVRFVYDGDNSAFPVGPGAALGPPGSGEIERVFHDYFASEGLPSAETPFSGRSDYGPFIAQGIPAGGLFTGAEGVKTAEQAEIYGGTAGVAYDACYHAACDTYANVNMQGLDEMSDAVAHATVHFANRKFDKNPLVNPPLAAGEGSGDSGGLHADDHEDETH